MLAHVNIKVQTNMFKYNNLTHSQNQVEADSWMTIEMKVDITSNLKK